MSGAGATQDDLYLAAARVFAAGGFHGVTLEDLTQSTGLSQEELLQRFQGKEGLFYETLRRCLDLVASGARPARDVPIEALLAALPKLDKAASSWKLRSIHREATSLLRSLSDATPGFP